MADRFSEIGDHSVRKLSARGHLEFRIAIGNRPVQEATIGIAIADRSAAASAAIHSRFRIEGQSTTRLLRAMAGGTIGNEDRANAGFEEVCLRPHRWREPEDENDEAPHNSIVRNTIRSSRRKPGRLYTCIARGCAPQFP